ncbi:hypothetical protein L1987_10864 [Smallanthus sonchifolius]|uniref:Uncharacterized protein n=1 Tax=Smallanthus sonchifolius TaxID=185202 RepID=A0ACB9JCS9_9ASTR|nr:hypothetical protein L1987_10864 [Smallanthus sonchifolius]
MATEGTNGVETNGAAVEKKTVTFTALKPQLFVEPSKASDAVAFYKSAIGVEEHLHRLPPSSASIVAVGRHGGVAGGWPTSSTSSLLSLSLSLSLQVRSREGEWKVTCKGVSGFALIHSGEGSMNKKQRKLIQKAKRF